MKRFFGIMTFAAIAAISFSACQQKDEITGKGDLIKATLSAGNPETKTVLEEGVPYWMPEDAIGVSDGNSNHRFDNDAQEMSAQTTFSGQTTLAGQLYAYYPYSSAIQISNGAVRLDIPSHQSPTLTSFDPSGDIMVSRPFVLDPETNAANLEFARLGAIVKVVFSDLSSELSSDLVESVSITSDKVLAGSVPVNLTNQTFGDIVGGETTVTAAFASGYTIDGSNAAWFVLYPQEFAEGETLDLNIVTDKHNIRKKITIPAGGMELPLGTVTTLNVKITAADVPYLSFESPDAMGIHWSGCNATIKVNSNIEWTVSSDNPVAIVSKDADGNVNVKMPAITKFTNVVANITIAPVDQTLGIAPQTKTLTQKPLMKNNKNCVVNADGTMTLTGVAGSTQARMVSTEKFKLCDYTFTIKEANLSEGAYFHINTWGTNGVNYQVKVKVGEVTLTSSGKISDGVNFGGSNVSVTSNVPTTLAELNSVKTIRVRVVPWTSGGWNKKAYIQVYLDEEKIIDDWSGDRNNPWYPNSTFAGLDTYFGIDGAAATATIASFEYLQLSQTM